MVPGDVDAKGKFCVGDIAYDIGLAPPCGLKGTDRPDQAGVREKIQMLGDGGKADA